MSLISADKLRQEIQLILTGADLNTLSSKKVRQMLETKFECNLTERKKEIDDILMAEITARDIQPISTNQMDNQNESQTLNEDSQADDNNQPIIKPPPPPPEKLPMEIQQQENRPSIRQSISSTTSTIVYKKPTTPSLKIERRRTCYNKELDISDQLAVVVGGHRMPRSEVVKRMWVYFKEHNLLDPINKQWVNCDDTLSKLFGRKRVRAFGMLKDLSRHMSDPDKQQ
jgi:upstream activation factor subunit UAF30